MFKADVGDNRGPRPLPINSVEVTILRSLDIPDIQSRPLLTLQAKSSRLDSTLRLYEFHSLRIHLEESSSFVLLCKQKKTLNGVPDRSTNNWFISRLHCPTRRAVHLLGGSLQELDIRFRHVAHGNHTIVPTRPFS